MNQGERFQRGDAVVHPRRPQWGHGVVTETWPISHNGRPAQRVAIDFINRGLVIINTAIAPLVTKGQFQPMSQPTNTVSKREQTAEPSESRGWLADLERSANGNSHELWALPHGMTDLFATLGQRLDATIQSYAFSTEARSLIEWGVVQTGLDDPLTKYTRQELEQGFEHFARDRDHHLRDLVRQIKRSGETQTLTSALAKIRIPAARTALEKAKRA